MYREASDIFFPSLSVFQHSYHLVRSVIARRKKLSLVVFTKNSMPTDAISPLSSN